MATLYWYGGTGNWSSATGHWSTNSGNVPDADHVAPTSSDDVVFDTLSHTTNYTVTIDATSNCANLTMGAPLAGKVTCAGSSLINIYGNLDLSGGTAGITWSHTGARTFAATSGTKTINSNSVPFLGTTTFNGIGGTFQLTSNMITGSSSRAGAITLTNGTFDPNGYAVVLTGVSTITGSFSFYDLTCTPASAAKTDSLTLVNNITVTNLFTVSNGATVTNRVLVKSSVVGTARTITAASISIANADFQDITGAGAASWDMSAATGGSGDCGGNTMKALGSAAFTTAATQHWTNVNGGSWSTAANWTSRVPLPQDNVVMDCAFGTSKTVTNDMPRMGKSVDFTGATWTTALTYASSTPVTIYGGLTLISGLTVTGTGALTFDGRSSVGFNSFGISLPFNVTIGTGSSIFTSGLVVTLKSDLLFGSTKGLTINCGNFDAQDTNNNWNVTSTGLTTGNSGTRVITMGDGTWTMIGASTFGVNANNLTVVANSSTVKFTDTTASTVTFNGFGATFYNLWFARGASTGNNTISGSNTFTDIRDTGTVAHSFLVTAGTTQHVTTCSINGSVGQEITLNSTTTGTFALVKDGGGTISCDYLNIQHSVATPASTWYAGTHSTNNQAVATAGSGWIFTDVPSGGGNTAGNPFGFFANRKRVNMRSREREIN